MLHRRDAMIRVGHAGLGGLSLPLLWNARTAAAADSSANPERHPPTAKSCILLYLWGGPPQHDTFDPKPHAPTGIRSLFGTTHTAVPGVHICDRLPLTARHTDKMAIIRSFTHGSNTHEVGVYHTLTGKVNNTLAVPRNKRNRNDFPNMGAVVSRFSPRGDLPSSVTIPRPIGHDGVVYTGTYAGFLGPRHDPMELKPPGEVKAAAPHSLDLPGDLTTARLQSRFGLLRMLEEADSRMQGGRSRKDGVGARALAAGTTARFPATGLDLYREQAMRILTSPAARGAFDVSNEPQKLRDSYGRNEYGESFLLARRLIEAGVRLVTVTWYYICPDGNVANVWDNHGGTGSLGGITGYKMLEQHYGLPSLDRAYAALLDDLSQRGLLDETLVVMLGEFGRTPRINKKVGRDHWGACQSIALAGGGVRGGIVHGASDKNGAYPTRHPVKPEDVVASVYHAFGLPPETPIHDPQNRPHHISTGMPLAELFG